MGPLFFFMYINDLLQSVASLYWYKIFATLSVLGSSIAELAVSVEIALSKAGHWCSVNYLKLNLTKTKFIYFNAKSNFEISFY